MRLSSESGPGGKCRHGFPIAFRNSHIEELGWADYPSQRAPAGKALEHGDIVELHAGSETAPHFVKLGEDVARERHSADRRDRHLVTRGLEPARPLISDSRDPKTTIRLLANGGLAGGALG